jgi:hypothetical protein
MASDEPRTRRSTRHVAPTRRSEPRRSSCDGFVSPRCSRTPSTPRPERDHDASDAPGDRVELDATPLRRLCSRLVRDEAPPSCWNVAARRARTSRIEAPTMPQKASGNISNLRARARDPLLETSRQSMSYQRFDFDRHNPRLESLYEGSLATCPSMGFLSPSTFSDESSDQHRGSTPGCAAPSGFLDLVARYSTLALSALFRAESVRGVRAHRGFPLPGAGTAFSSPPSPPSVDSRAPPLSRRRASRHVASSSAASHRVSARELCIREVRSRRGGVTRVRRPILSQLSSPLRGFLPSSLDPAFAASTLMGFSAALDRSIATIALQSVKELEGRLASFESCLPPWGFCPESPRP